MSFCTIFMWEEASLWISQEKVVGGLSSQLCSRMEAYTVVVG